MKRCDVTSKKINKDNFDIMLKASQFEPLVNP